MGEPMKFLSKRVLLAGLIALAPGLALLMTPVLGASIFDMSVTLGGLTTGFTIALIPAGDDPRREIVPKGVRALRAPTIAVALQHMLKIAERGDGWTRDAIGPHNDTL